MLANVTVNISIIIFIVIVVIAALFIFISTALFFLHKRRPQVFIIESIKVHEFISLCISVLYFITVVVTLVVLIFQNKIISIQTNYALQSVEGSIFANITSQTLAQDQIFIQYPDLRPYFYEGKDTNSNDPLYHKIHATAEYLLDYYDSLESLMKKYPYLWIHERREWEANTVDMFAWSPVLCRYLEATKDWYSEELHTLKKAGEQKRQQGFQAQSFPRPKP